MCDATCRQKRVPVTETKTSFQWRKRFFVAFDAYTQCPNNDINTGGCQPLVLMSVFTVMNVYYKSTQHFISFFCDYP